MAFRWCGFGFLLLLQPSDRTRTGHRGLTGLARLHQQCIAFRGKCNGTNRADRRGNRVPGWVSMSFRLKNGGDFVIFYINEQK